MVWRALSIRVTIFPTPRSPDWYLQWADVVGAGEPEGRTTPVQRVETAPFGVGRIQLRQQLPPKVDLVYLPSTSPDAAAPTPDVGPFEDAFVAFLEPATRLLNAPLPVTRLAIGTQLSRTVANVQEANEILAGHIRNTRFDLGGASDFLYQINRPRESRILPGLVLNRLVKWQTVQWRVLTLEPGSGRQYEEPRDFAAVLELDLNTQGERETPLPAALLPSLLDELKTFAREIAEQGDIR